MISSENIMNKNFKYVQCINLRDLVLRLYGVWTNLDHGRIKVSEKQWNLSSYLQKMVILWPILVKFHDTFYIFLDKVFKVFTPFRATSLKNTHEQLLLYYLFLYFSVLFYFLYFSMFNQFYYIKYKSTDIE